jgi:hypothetical protein
LIWESKYWKDDLLRRAQDLRKRSTQKKWFESSFAKVEQSIMIGFYSIRKLIEAKKLSDEISDMRVQLPSYPSKVNPITIMNWHKFDKLYDLNSKLETDLSLLELCHQFVHSYIFIPELYTQGGLRGIFFASDRARLKRLYFIDIQEIISIFQLTGSNYPSRITMEFDSSTQDYDVSIW